MSLLLFTLVFSNPFTTLPTPLTPVKALTIDITTMIIEHTKQ